MKDNDLDFDGAWNELTNLFPFKEFNGDYISNDDNNQFDAKNFETIHFALALAKEIKSKEINYTLDLDIILMALKKSPDYCETMSDRISRLKNITPQGLMRKVKEELNG